MKNMQSEEKNKERKKKRHYNGPFSQRLSQFCSFLLW